MKAQKVTRTNGLIISYEPLETLRPYQRHTRTHSKKQIQQIKRSIEENGFVNPVLIDENRTIIAGHARVAAAKLLEMTEVPTVVLSHMTDAQKRAFMIAENKLCTLAGWNDDALRIEFQGLIDEGFDIELTGFDIGEVDFLIHAPAELDDETLSDIPIKDITQAAVTQPGYLWQLGSHRLYCGDSLQSDSFLTVLLNGERADMALTDPPYNVPIDGHVCGKGNVKHEEFAMAVGEMSGVEFTAFLDATCRLMVEHTKKSGLIYTFMDWRHIGEMLAAGQGARLKLINLVVWNKQNAGMGSLYRSKHELVFVWSNGENHRNNVLLGRYGRNRSNVWDYAGANSFGKNRSEKLSWHPTLKPCSMIADAILDCTKPNDVVLDPFGGAGTTLIACERTKRHARVVELEPRYVDLTIRRWEKLTGQKAICLANGKSFAELEQRLAGKLSNV